MRSWWSGLAWQPKLFIIWGAFSALFLLSAKLGLITFEGDGQGPRQFDRQECLRRTQERLFPGMFLEDLSDEAQSRIAAACAHEQFG